MKKVEIKVNWNNEQSIKLSEKKKAELENKGYQMVSHFGGINSSSLLYVKKD